MIKRIMPVIVICCVFISTVCFPAAAAESYLEPFEDNSKQPYSDTQYIYDHYKVAYNGCSSYVVNTGGTNASFEGNNFFHEGTVKSLKLYAYPMGNTATGEIFVSLESLRKNGEELLSVRIPITMALANTGYNYITDVVVAIEFYDSSFNSLKIVGSSESVEIKGSNAWFFIDPGAIDIPNIPNAAYFNIRFNVTVSVAQWVKVKWGSLDLVTRRSKTDDILTGGSAGEDLKDVAGDLDHDNNELGGAVGDLGGAEDKLPSMDSNIQNVIQNNIGGFGSSDVVILMPWKDAEYSSFWNTMFLPSLSALSTSLLLYFVFGKAKV